jgi:hypothetical protein
MMQTEVAKPLKQEFSFLLSNDPDRLWEVKSRIESFYRDNAKFFSELENEVDDAYSRQMASYIIDSAINIRTTFRCPRGWKEGLPWINMFPPAPQPEQMRNGLVSKDGSSEAGALKTATDESDAGRRYTVLAKRFKEQLRNVSRVETAMDEGESVGDEDDDYGDEEYDTAMNVDEEQASRRQPIAGVDGHSGGQVTDERAGPDQQQTRQTAADFGNFGDSDEDNE